MRGPTLVLASLVLSLLPRPAAAHIEITSHQTRTGKDDQKQAPCGLAEAPRGDAIYTYRPGETISIAWHEFIDHPGHYRVSFDAAGDDDFVTPSADDETYVAASVLLDGIVDAAGVHDYEVEVALPELECEACTIQVIQVMTDKPPFGDGNDVYFHCIDVRLDADAPTTGPEPTDADAGACTCTSADSRTRGLASLLALALLVTARRRSSGSARAAARR